MLLFDRSEVVHDLPPELLRVAAPPPRSYRESQRTRQTKSQRVRETERTKRNP
eukprot:COSAG03_NODE_25645_length_264_cov_0.800000_1_plen_52_part_10